MSEKISLDSSALITKDYHMNYIISEVSRNFIIIDGEPEFRKWLLFPHNIVYDGMEMSLPFSLQIMKKLQTDNTLLNGIKIISRFGDNQDNAILLYDCKEILHAPNYETTLSENCVYKGKVIAKTSTFAIIAVNGCYGYVDEPNDKEFGDIMSVVLTRVFVIS